MQRKRIIISQQLSFSQVPTYTYIPIWAESCTYKSIVTRSKLWTESEF